MKFNYARIKQITWWFLFVSLIVSISMIVFEMVNAPQLPQNDSYRLTKGDYILPFIQCLLGLIVMFLPQILERSWSVGIPNYMQILYFIFLYCAIYLGDVQNFYYTIPNWDVVLHAMSGALFGSFGFYLVSVLNDSPRVHMKLSPIFVALFAFCFAVASGAVWEIYEYLCDSFFGTNMQKFILVDGTVLSGHAAVSDTMEDIITDAVSGFVISAIGFISLKKRARKLKKKKTKDKQLAESLVR